MHSNSGYDALPLIPISGLSGRAGRCPNQAESAVRVITQVLSTPTEEWCSAYIPYVSALDSEHLGDARVGVPSESTLEVPCLGTAVVPVGGDVPVDPPYSANEVPNEVGVVGVVTGLSSDVTFAEGVLDCVIEDIFIPNSITLSEALVVVSRLSETFTAAVRQFSLVPVTSFNFMGLLESCRLEFSRHETERAAREDAKDFVMPLDVTGGDLADLLASGSLENLVCARHECAMADRLTIDRLNQSFGLVRLREIYGVMTLPTIKEFLVLINVEFPVGGAT